MQKQKFRFNPIELGHHPTATAGGTPRGCPGERAALHTATAERLRGCPGERAALHTATAERLRGCLGERAALHTATAEWLRGWARAGRRGLLHRTTTPGWWWQPFPASTGRRKPGKNKKRFVQYRNLF